MTPVLSKLEVKPAGGCVVGAGVAERVGRAVGKVVGVWEGDEDGVRVGLSVAIGARVSLLAAGELARGGLLTGTLQASSRNKPIPAQKTLMKLCIPDVWVRIGYSSSAFAGFAPSIARILAKAIVLYKYYLVLDTLRFKLKCILTDREGGVMVGDLIAGDAQRIAPVLHAAKSRGSCPGQVA